MGIARRFRARPQKLNINNPGFRARQRPQLRGEGDLYFATEATAGAPGTWGPQADVVVPETPARVIASIPRAITPVPDTAWTAGQYVQTQLAGAPGQVHWNGTAWEAGTA